VRGVRSSTCQVADAVGPGDPHTGSRADGQRDTGENGAAAAGMGYAACDQGGYRCADESGRRGEREVGTGDLRDRGMGHGNDGVSLHAPILPSRPGG